MNYKLVNYTADINTPHKLHADVIETTTNQIVAHSMEVPKARDIIKKLNSGGGFNGLTPAFFLNIIPKPTFSPGE